jgi:hypothetical protein
MLFTSGKLKINVFIVDDIGKQVLDYVTAKLSSRINEDDFYSLFYAIGNLDTDSYNTLLNSVNKLINNYS